MAVEFLSSFSVEKGRNVDQKTPQRLRWRLPDSHRRVRRPRTSGHDQKEEQERGRDCPRRDNPSSAVLAHHTHSTPHHKGRRFVYVACVFIRLCKYSLGQLEEELKFTTNSNKVDGCLILGMIWCGVALQGLITQVELPL